MLARQDDVRIGLRAVLYEDRATNEAVRTHGNFLRFQFENLLRWNWRILASSSAFHREVRRLLRRDVTGNAKLGI